MRHGSKRDGNMRLFLKFNMSYGGKKLERDMRHCHLKKCDVETPCIIHYTRKTEYGDKIISTI